MDIVSPTKCNTALKSIITKMQKKKKIRIEKENPIYISPLTFKNIRFVQWFQRSLFPMSNKIRPCQGFQRQNTCKRHKSKDMVELLQPSSLSVSICDKLRAVHNVRSNNKYTMYSAFFFVVVVFSPAFLFISFGLPLNKNIHLKLSILFRSVREIWRMAHAGPTTCHK